MPILSSTTYSYPVCMDPVHVRAVAKTNRRIKSSMFKDLPGPPTNPSPLISHFPKVRVTPEVPGELSNTREEEKSLREWGWCTGSHYRLWWCWAWLGWENQPHKGSWLWESRHALEHLGGVRRGDKIWKHDMLHYLARLEQYTPHVFSPSSHLYVWPPKGGPPLRAGMVQPLAHKHAGMSFYYPTALWSVTVFRPCHWYAC